MTAPNHNHAVVIGGSMSGLLAARVLAGHFDHVTLLERDHFPAPGEQRKSVPQGRHTHGLLASGASVLEQLLPGLRQDLLDAGAVTADVVERGRWFHQGGYLRQVPSGLDAVALSRPLLEGLVRRRVLAVPNIRAVPDCEVTGLTTTPDRSRVTGVTLRDGTSLPADLTIHAGGRASHSPDWLQQLGYDKPRTERVEIALAYTTRLFRRCPSDLSGNIAAIIPPTPSGKRGGVLLAQEHNRWTVTLISHFCSAAPHDLQGFREFARDLPASDIHDVIRDAEPLGEPQGARFPASLRQRYEHLQRFPAGFLVFGDAICSFNPIYGQGMSVAALQSMALRDCLCSPSHDLAKAFFTRAAKVVDIPWSIAAGNDLRMPEATGPRTPAVRFINWYIAKLHQAAHHDPELSLAFHRVANLLEPPPSLMKPKMIWRVVRGNLFTPSPAQDRKLAAAG